MKFSLTTSLVLCVSICFGQYNYGLEVEQQDAKIEGKLNLVDGISSVFIGANAGINDDGSNNQNTVVGTNAGSSITTRSYNAFFGYNAGINSTGGQNTLIGSFSGEKLTSGFSNTFIGHYSGLRSTTGISNVMIGTFAGSAIDGGSNNTIIGNSAGPSSGQGTIGFGNNNVFIGHLAGSFLTKNDSNKLVVESLAQNQTTYPLIYGEFDNNLLRVNGTLHISETAKLEPQSGPPSTCTTAAEYGLMYYDSSVTPNKLRLCSDTGWNDLN